MMALTACIGQTYAQNPGKALSSQKGDIATLINQLQNIGEGDTGYSSTMTGSGFLPLGVSQASVLVLGQGPTTNATPMRQLVEQGIAAIPGLIAHLNDKRPTRRTITHNLGLGGMFFEDEYDYNHRTTAKQPVGVNRGLGHSFQESRHSHTVTVGDLCFVALGQIVNRQFNAVRYQPTACIMINSPTDSDALRAAIVKEWGNLTPEQHKASLVQDFLHPDFENRRIGATLRLGYYYPE